MKARNHKYCKVAVILLLFVLSVSLSSCGSSENHYSAIEGTDAIENSAYGYDEKGAAFDAEPSATDEWEDTEKTVSENNVATNRKLIKDGSLSLQTVTFDSFMAQLEKEVNALGGYISNRIVGGGNFYYNDCRNASVTVRIPAEKFDSFTYAVAELATVTEKTESVRDVTSDYIDIESHITALETEQKTLLSVMEKATKVSEIIEVQNALSEVRSQLENYKGQLKSFDDLIAYSTVTLQIDEVERVTEPEQEGFFSEIKNRLSDNLYQIGQGARNFAIWFISSLPYLLIIAVIFIIVFLLIRRKVKKRKAKKAEKEQAE